MFRFEHPEFFLLLFLIPVWLLLYWLRSRLNLHAWKRWNPLSQMGKVRTIPYYAIGAGLLFSIFALVNPQYGFKSESLGTRTANVYMVMDISNSMYATDLPPSRLDRARHFGITLSEKLASDRVGLVFFAGNAYIQSPLTYDWQAIRLFLEAADPVQAGTQGTSISKALDLVIRSNEQSTTPQKGAIIILTDGEDHEGDAEHFAEVALEKGWHIYVIGVGTEEGSTIPARNEFGGMNVIRDDQGQPVVSKLNPQFLSSVARAGGGKYFTLGQDQSIMNELTKEIQALSSENAETRIYTEHRSMFQWFLLPALLCFAFAGIRYRNIWQV